MRVAKVMAWHSGSSVFGCLGNGLGVRGNVTPDGQSKTRNMVIMATLAVAGLPGASDGKIPLAQQRSVQKGVEHAKHRENDAT